MTFHQAIDMEGAALVRKPGMANQTTTKTLNLALQGGGAHGAFTWGVLDRLLEDERLNFEGVVATSAGGMNAAVLADGLVEGGRQGVRKALANFWRRVSHAAALSPMNWAFLTDLRDSGRACACQGLDENFERIGKESSVDLHETYL